MKTLALATALEGELDYCSHVPERRPGPTKMDIDEFNQKLDQIEEQAQLTLAEFPKTLTKERQRMIIALVRYIRAEAERSAAFHKPDMEGEAGTRLRSV
jgi:hypothetical protein